MQPQPVPAGHAPPTPAPAGYNGRALAGTGVRLRPGTPHGGVATQRTRYIPSEISVRN